MINKEKLLVYGNKLQTKKDAINSEIESMIEALNSKYLERAKIDGAIETIYCLIEENKEEQA